MDGGKNNNIVDVVSEEGDNPGMSKWTLCYHKAPWRMKVREESDDELWWQAEVGVSGEEDAILLALKMKNETIKSKNAESVWKLEKKS